jgi:hypothetical protein
MAGKLTPKRLENHLSARDSSSYVGAVVVLVIAFVFEFGVAMREEWSRREVEKLE